VTQDLIERATAGSRQARDQLLRELADPWFRFSLSILRDAELAREAVQETAVRFLQQLSGFRGQSQLKTWSLGIALNVTREMRRKRSIGSDEALDATGSPLHGPDTSAELSEMQAMLHSSLHELSDRQREAVVLRFFEDLSVEETAATMKCAAGTVKATVHQALRLLKTKLMKAI
jgi:RNA polymerase sigma-70 factor, ECF subfamily